MHGTCRVENCSKLIMADGFCINHSHLRKDKICSTIDCGRGMYAKGLCHYHYNETKRPLKLKKCEFENCIKMTAQQYCYRHKKRNEEVRIPTKSRRGENNWNWKGGIAEYPNHTEFKRQRKIILRLANHKCEECGGRATEVHHLDISKDNHALDNLKALCHKCHMGIYHKDRRYKPTLIPNFTLKDIADKTGISVATVRKYILEYKPKIESAIQEVTQGA